MVQAVDKKIEMAVNILAGGMSKTSLKHLIYPLRILIKELLKLK